MPDAHANLAYSTVAVAPSPAASGTTLTVAAGQGSRFPAGSYNCTVWATGSIPLPSNAEIVRVTNVSSDTLTITRAQEGTSARTIVVGDQIALTITAKTLTDIETDVSNVVSAVQVVSNALSVASAANAAAHTSLEAHASAASAAATSVDGRLVSVNDRISVASALASAADAHASVASAAATSADGHAATASAAATSADAHAAAASAAATSVDARVNAVSNAISVVSNALSALEVRVSTISAAGGGGSVTSNELSAVLSAHDALSNVVSNLISAGGGGTSVTSNELSAAAAALSARIQSVLCVDVSALSAANASNHVSINDRISIASALASAADAHASVASIAATSVDTRLVSVNDRISVASALASAADAHASIASLAATSADGHANTASAAATSADAHAAAASAAATSVDARVNTVSNLVSALTSAVANLSVLGSVRLRTLVVAPLQSALGDGASTTGTIRWRELSANGNNEILVRAPVALVSSLGWRLPTVNPTAGQMLGCEAVGSTSIATLSWYTPAGGTVSVTSNELSAVSQTASVNNASIMAYICAVSARTTGDVSVRGLQSIVNALSSRLSQVGGGAGSVTSNEASAISQTASAANASIMNVISQRVGGSAPPNVYVSGAQTFITTVLSAISGLTIPMSGGVIYQLDAQILFNKHAAGGGVAKLGMTFPTMNATRGNVLAMLSTVQGGGIMSNMGWQWNGNSASGSVLISALSHTLLSVVFNFTGVFDVNTGGNLIFFAGTTTAGTSQVLRGSYARLRRIN